MYVNDDIATCTVRNKLNLLIYIIILYYYGTTTAAATAYIKTDVNISNVAQSLIRSFVIIFVVMV